MFPSRRLISIRTSCTNRCLKFHASGKNWSVNSLPCLKHSPHLHGFVGRMVQLRCWRCSTWSRETPDLAKSKTIKTWNRCIKRPVHVEDRAFCAARTRQEMTNNTHRRQIHRGSNVQSQKGNKLLLPTQILKPFSVLRAFKGPEEPQFSATSNAPVQCCECFGLYSEKRGVQNSRSTYPQSSKEKFVGYIHFGGFRTRTCLNIKMC